MIRLLPFFAFSFSGQVKVDAIQSNSLSLSWMPIQQLPWSSHHVTYCIVYHPSATDLDDDVHSSTCARHRDRMTSFHAGCTQSTSRVLDNLESSVQYDIEVFARNLVTDTETAYLAVTASTAAPPVQLFSSTERVGVLPPLHSQVYTLQMQQNSAMHVAVSPCKGNLRWSVLNEQGRPVKHFRPELKNNAPTSLQTAGNSQAGVGFSLGQADLSFQEKLRGKVTYRVVVQNLAKQPAKFELFASSNGASLYPTLPPDSQVKVEQTSWRSMVVRWDPSQFAQNLTYCVHVYPHNQAREMKVIHSRCGLQEAAKKRVFRDGECAIETRRVLPGLNPNVWYDVDVIAKNTFTKKSRAYTSVRALTRPASTQTFGARSTASTSTCFVLPLLMSILLSMHFSDNQFYSMY